MTVQVLVSSVDTSIRYTLDCQWRNRRQTSSESDLSLLEHMTDLVQGPGRLTRWSRGLFVVYITWFCNEPQQPGSEACVGEPVGERPFRALLTASIWNTAFLSQHLLSPVVMNDELPEERRRWRMSGAGSQERGPGGSPLWDLLLYRGNLPRPAI